MTDFTELVLTCGSWQEAQRAADVLFEKGFIHGAEFLKVPGGEIKLIIQTLENDIAIVNSELGLRKTSQTLLNQGKM